jgi:hypothetical protein
VVVRAPAPADAEEPEQIARRDRLLGSRYELREIIGSGRSGDVIRAVSRDSGEPVAVKLLGRLTDPAVPRLFAMGEGLPRAVGHPAVVDPIQTSVVDSASGRQIAYLVRPLVEGRSLALELATGPLNPERALRILGEILSALAAAHRAGVVHGDPKPSDVILTPEDKARLVDAAVPREPLPAGLPGRPLPVGTPEYLAPERTAGGPATSASDVYAVGAIALEMMGGANPFRRSSASASLAAHDGPVPELPSDLAAAYPDLNALLRAALARDAAERPGASDALRIVHGQARQAAARGAVVTLPLPRSSAGTVPRGAEIQHGWRARAIAAAIVAAGLVSAAVVLAPAVRHRAPAPIESPEPVVLLPGPRSLGVTVRDRTGSGPVRVRCWQAGMSGATAQELPLQPGSGPSPMSVLFTGLVPNTEYVVRAFRDPGDAREPERRIRTLSSPADLVRSMAHRYRRGGRIDLSLQMRYAGIGVEVRTAAGQVVRRAAGPGGHVDGCTVILPLLGSTDLTVRVPDLGTEVPLGSLPGALERARGIAAALAKLGDSAFARSAAPDSAGAGPVLAEVARHAGRPPPPPRELERTLSVWCARHAGASADEISQLAEAVAGDEAVDASDRWIFYGSLRSLETLDTIAEAAAGEPVLGIARRLERLVTSGSRPVAGAAVPDGYRPLDSPELAATTRAMLRKVPLPLFTAPPAGVLPTHLEARALEIFRSLQDDDPLMPGVRLPMPSRLPGEGHAMEVWVRVAGISPGVWVEADLGEGARARMRSLRSPAAPTLAGSMIPDRGVLEPTSEWLYARFPAPSAPAAITIAAGEVAAAWSAGATVPAAIRRPTGPPIVWLLDVVVRRARAVTTASR